MTGHHMGKVFVLKLSHGGRQGGRWGPKIPFLAPKRAILGNRGQKTPPSGPTGTYKKTEGIQSYLRTWGRYDLIESGLSEAKKMSYVGIA